MKCRPLRHGDQMQCPCGLAWDVDEEKPQCRNAVHIVEQVEIELVVNTPLGGLPQKNVDLCRCEGKQTAFKDCGCAFGQCAKGLVF